MRFLYWLAFGLIPACQSIPAEKSPIETCGVSSSEPRTVQQVHCVLTETVSLRHEIQLHYQRALRNAPLLNGRIIFSLTISPQGHAAVTVTSNELGDEKLTENIVNAFEALEFGITLGESILVEYPIHFSSP